MIATIPRAIEARTLNALAAVAPLPFNEFSEEAAHLSCQRIAVRNGHTAEQADACAAGDVGCPDCPFWKRGAELEAAMKKNKQRRKKK